MTAERRLEEAVKSVRQQWGHGFDRLGLTLQQALVRAEVLGFVEVSGLDLETDPVAYRDGVSQLTALAMQWPPSEAR
jgi:hypothetical protein